MSHLTEGVAVSLTALLSGRDRRSKKQHELFEKYGMTVVTLTVNMPGSIKLCLLSQMIFSAAQKALHDALPPPVFHSAQALPHGVEGFFVYNIPQSDVKKITCEIEDTHIIGRLMDIDVFGENRTALGQPSRKCLLCQQDAFVCARSRAHSLEQLLQKMEEMYIEYENS